MAKATNRGIVESLWSLYGVDEAKLRPYLDFQGSEQELMRELTKLAPAKLVDQAKKMDEWRADKKKSFAENIDSYLQNVMGMKNTHLVGDRAKFLAGRSGIRQGGKDYADGDIIDALRDFFNPNQIAQMVIKANPDKNVAGAILKNTDWLPDWNPLRGDKPVGVGAPEPAPPPAPMAPTNVPTPGGVTKGVGPKGLRGPGAGAGGKAGGGGGGGAGPIAPPKRGAGDVDAYIQEHYGHVAYLLTIPEIAQKVKDAEAQGWDDSRIVGELEGTNWWKTTDKYMRLYQDQKITDPATALKERSKQVANIKTEAAKYGLNISDQRLNEIADNVLSLGWNPSQTAEAMAHEFHYQSGGPDPAVVGQLKKLAGDYYIPLSDQAIEQWGQSVIQNQGDDTMFQQYVKEQAKSMFPTAAGAIDRGVSIKTFTDPYRQLASQYLEVDPDSINFSDPKYLKALNQVDPKTGDVRLMSLSEWTDNIKRDPTYGWDKTENARSQATSLAGKIAEVFGGGL